MSTARLSLVHLDIPAGSLLAPYIRAWVAGHAPLAAWLTPLAKRELRSLARRLAPVETAGSLA